MANIARLEVGTEWVDLETEIENFSPEEGDQYEIQNIGGTQYLQVYEGATAPTQEKNGFVVKPFKTGTWTKEDGQKLFVAAVDGQVTINIAKI